MKKRTKTLAILAAVAMLALAGCTEEWSWHQKLTVTVETPDGEVSGSAVTEIRWQELNSVGNYPGSYRGEATVVEVAPGRYLFALLSENTRYMAVLHVFPDLAPGGSTGKGYAAMAQVRGTREVPRKSYPLMVTFGDIADPTTVKRVDPDDLAATFGPGYSLQSVTLEITDEPVTGGRVEQVLPWLEAVGRERATLIPNPPRLSTELVDPAIQLLSPGGFSTELYK